MARLSLTILKNKPNKDGSFNIKISISAQSKTVYIPTRFSVNSGKEWRYGRVVKRFDADLLNRKLARMLMEYEDILAENPMTDFLSASATRDYLLRKANNTDLIRDYAIGYIEALRQNGQDSYATNLEYSLKYLLECFGENVAFPEITLSALGVWEKFLFGKGSSATTVNIRMTHLKALLNSAVNDEVAEYKIFPFRNYRMPQKSVRDICISREEFRKLRDSEFKGVSAKRLSVARDLFLLSFYCAGINLTDLMDADLSENTLTFVRKKTAGKKKGEKRVSLTIQPEAREIAGKYLTPDGKLDFGYRYAKYEHFRSFVTKSLNRLGIELGFEKKLMFYSARKTFCQFGFELGIPLFVLEYAIGQTVKDANNRPIFNYIKIMRTQADTAIRTVLDYVI